MLAERGTLVKSRNLFRAAILESGSSATSVILDPSNDTKFAYSTRYRNPVFPPSALQSYFDGVVSSVNCSSASDPIACLRLVPSDTLYNAVFNVWTEAGSSYSFGRVIDGFFHNQVSSLQIKSGAVAQVPFIIGDCLDEVSENAWTEGLIAPYSRHYATGHIIPSSIE